MPTPPSDEPLERVTVQLYEKDVAALRRLGYGWTGKIRELVRRYVKGEAKPNV